MAIRKVNDHIVRMKVFGLPRHKKYQVQDLWNGEKLIVWRCPRCEVYCQEGVEAHVHGVNQSWFDAKTDPGSGFARFDPKRVEMEFDGGNLYSPNRIYFRLKVN